MLLINMGHVRSIVERFNFYLFQISRDSILLVIGDAGFNYKIVTFLLTSSKERNVYSYELSTRTGVAERQIPETCSY